MSAFFQDAARATRSDAAIVEVGVWLGSGVGQIATALAERRAEGHETPVIHCYDRWKASESEVEKAFRFNVDLAVGENTLPRVVDTLRPFGVEMHFHRGKLSAAKWRGGKIGLYVDDAAKRPSDFRKVMRLFGPSWTPGETTVVLMDFHYYKFNGDPELQAQSRFVAQYSECFEPLDIGPNPPGSAAAFNYVKKIDFEAAVAAGHL